MKRLFIVIAFCILICQGLQAQVDLTINHHPSWRERRPLIISGLVIGAVGCGTALYGVLDYHANDNAPHDNRKTDLAIIGGGAGLAVIGGGLIYLGLTRGVYFKWSVINPKRNEIGFAYNF